MELSPLMLFTILLVPGLGAAQDKGSADAPGTDNGILLWGLVGGILGLLFVFMVALALLYVLLKYRKREHRRMRESRASQVQLQRALMESRRRNISNFSVSASADGDGVPSTDTTLTTLESKLSTLALQSGSEILLSRARLEPQQAPNIVLTFRQSPPVGPMKTKTMPATGRGPDSGSSNILLPEQRSRTLDVNNDPAAFTPQLARALDDRERGSEEMELIWPRPVSLAALTETSREQSRESTLNKSSSGANTLAKSSLTNTDIPESGLPPIEKQWQRRTFTDVSPDTTLDLRQEEEPLLPPDDTQQHRMSTPRPLTASESAVSHLDELQLTLNQELMNDGIEESEEDGNGDEIVTTRPSAALQADTMQSAQSDATDSAFVENGQSQLEIPTANIQAAQVGDSPGSGVLFPQGRGDEMGDTLDTMDSGAYDGGHEGREDTGMSFGLDEALWEAAETSTQPAPEQPDIWDAIHGFYDHSAHALHASTIMSDRSNVDEDLEQLNKSIDTLQELRKMESKERKAAKNVNRRSQPIVHAHEGPSVFDIFPQQPSEPKEEDKTPSEVGNDTLQRQPRHASSPAPIESNQSSLGHIVDNAEKDYLEAPVFRTPRIDEVDDAREALTSNSLFVNPMYTPIAQSS